MNAKARTARKTIRTRRAQHDSKTVAAAKTAWKATLHTIASHLFRAGIDAETATGMAGSLRSRLAKTPRVRGYAGRSLTDTRRGPVARFTWEQILSALAGYKPRKAAYIAALALI